jgi:hypothetical protein
MKLDELFCSFTTGLTSLAGLLSNRIEKFSCVDRQLTARTQDGWPRRIAQSRFIKY